MPATKKPATPKPLSAAERSRKYREKKAREAAEAAAAAASSPSELRDEPRDATPERDASHDVTPPAPARQSQLDQVNLSIAAMKWLEPSDGAAVELLRGFAQQLDELLENDPTATGKAASLGQIIMRILHELGGTPTVRLQNELRALRPVAPRDPDSETGDEDADTLPVNKGGRTSKAAQRRTEATVTSITRPAKRRRA